MPDPAPVVDEGQQFSVKAHILASVDKLIVFCLIAYLSGLLVHSAHHQPADVKLIEGLTGMVNNLIGALIALLTGGAIAAVARRNGGK